MRRLSFSGRHILQTDSDIDNILSLIDSGSLSLIHHIQEIVLTGYTLYFHLGINVTGSRTSK